ncbi:proline-rich domain-containing protein [Arthrobacter bambusae]|uniref:proline-rich domain-containing protein n=1 Tax=Arthrobacter bambusae TaxID=1338426 RepID=UPI002780DAF1|nr:proline-rich domain-containing protein [Arthrobacter bambusae]MDQ0030220.1 hypothetical protein [Arthrobacter bambusae]MDQ0097902.1 hypothetical protein [Arthrobacter bambusae]
MSQPDPGNRPEQGPQPWGGQPQWGGTPQPGPQPWGGQPQWGGAPQPGPQPWGGQPQWGAPVDPRWPAGGPPPYGQPRYVAPPKPGIVPLRPLFFGEIMDGAFQTIRRNAKTMFGSALIVQAITGALSGVVEIATLGMAQPPAGGFTSQDEATQYLSPLLGATAGIMGISLLAMVLTAILQGVMAIPVARSALNRPTGFKQMWSLARSRIWPLVGFASLLLAGSLLFLLVLFLLAALIVTGSGPAGVLLLLPLGFGALVVFAWIYTKLLVAPAAITIEELGVFAGLHRSWTLTTWNWWRIFGITLLVSFMVGIIGEVIQIPLRLASGGMTSVFAPHAGAAQVTTTSIVLLVVSLIVGALVGAVGFAFQTSVAALIYMDLRMRRDGLDVELLRLLETGEDPDGVPGRRRARQAGAQSWPPATGQGFPTG